MRKLSLKTIINSKYKDFFSFEELYGIPDLSHKKFEFEQRLLNEGLILTHPINKSIEIIERSGFEVIVIEQKSWENRFYVSVSDYFSDVDKLMKLTNNLGWFCSSIRNADSKGSVKTSKYTSSNLKRMLLDYDEIWLLFEPKYDIELDLSKYQFLYHFTKKVYWDSIKKNGLTPQNQNKTSTHPERIYLALTIYAAEKFGLKFDVKIPLNKKDQNKQLSIQHNKIEDNYKGLILKIDVSNMPEYFKIYSDPNYYKEGCFTLNSIPRNVISIIKEIDLK